MPKIVYVGQTTCQVGKTLWEIVGNLKNFGVGRLIIRGTHLRFPEPSFYKIVKLETLPIPYDGGKNYSRRVVAWVEKVFRGMRYPKLIELRSSTYKPDFRLIPKDEEELWYKRLAECKPEVKIIDPTKPLPPLLNLMLKQEKKAKGEAVPDVITTRLPLKTFEGVVRLAQEGETPTVRFPASFGSPAAPSLFENIEACRPLFENRNPWKDNDDNIRKMIENKNQQ